MAGGSPAASDDLRPMGDRRPLHTALHRMAAVKTNQIIVPADPVQACRLHLFQMYFFSARIPDTRASCDNIIRREHTIQKRHLHAAHCIFHIDLQRLRLAVICIDSREPLYFIFSL